MMRKLVCIGLFMLAPIVMNAQGMIDGFMRGAGKGMAALSYSNERFKDFWEGEHLYYEANIGTVTTQSVAVMLSQGITNQIDVVAMLPYISSSFSQGTLASQSNLQDLAFAVKFRPYQLKSEELGTLSAILSAGVSTPTTDYIPDAANAIGNHVATADARLTLAFESTFGLFVNAQYGYIRRGSLTLDRGYKVNVPDAGDMVVKLGFMSKIVSADVWIQNQNARGGIDINQRGATQQGYSFPATGASFTRLGINAALPFQNFSIDLNGFRLYAGYNFISTGKNIGKSTRFSTGLMYEYTLWQ